MRPLVEKHLTDTRHGLSTHCLLQGRGLWRLPVTHHNGSSQRPGHRNANVVKRESEVLATTLPTAHKIYGALVFQRWSSSTTFKAAHSRPRKYHSGRRRLHQPRARRRSTVEQAAAPSVGSGHKGCTFVGAYSLLRRGQLL